MIFFFKQKTAYEMRISDWSSDVCSSDLPTDEFGGYGNVLYGSDNWVVLEGAVSGPISDTVRARFAGKLNRHDGHRKNINMTPGADRSLGAENNWGIRGTLEADLTDNALLTVLGTYSKRSEEHTSELQSLMRISYAVFCLKKKTHKKAQSERQHIQQAKET